MHAPINPSPLHVVLIQPSEPFGKMAEIPLSIIGLAAVLQQGGCTVEILDARIENLSVSQTIKRLENKRIDVVGITGLVNAYRYIKDFCFEFKRRFPETPIIAGGTFILSQPDRILERTPIDVACTGEGEEVILELVTRLANNESLDGLNNIAYIKDGELVRTPIKPIQDFDILPLPAYDLLDMSQYLKAHHVKHWRTFYFPITTGRGCVHHCYYCGRASNKVRRQSPDRLLEHLDLLNTRYGLKAFLFSEDSTFYPRDWCEKFCELMIQSKRGYQFAMGGCPEQLDETFIKTLIQAGCTQIGIAVEHWNPEIQKGFHRGTQSKHIIKGWELFKKYDLHNNGFNILWGHPKDTVQSFKQTYLKSIELAKKHEIPHFWLATLVIYPNSKLLKDAIAAGKILDYEDYMYAHGGYAPFVNLTAEDDDVFRGVIVEQRLISYHIELALEKMKWLVFNDVSPDANQWIQLAQRLENEIQQLTLLRQLLSLPMHLREQYRDTLEAILNVPMYDPKLNHYHEIGCFRELLELGKGCRIAVYGTGSFGGDNLGKLFNSVREAQAEIVGFVDSVAAETTFEGRRLVPFADLGRLEADYIIIPEDTPDIKALTEILSNCLPDLKIVKLGKANLAPKPWALNGLNSGYYNDEFWKIRNENGQLERSLTCSARGDLGERSRPRELDGGLEEAYEVSGDSREGIGSPGFDGITEGIENRSFVPPTSPDHRSDALAGHSPS